jgi:hypothetical protein
MSRVYISTPSPPPLPPGQLRGKYEKGREKARKRFLKSE